MESESTSRSASEEPWLEVTASRGFVGWLANQQVSLAFTTYQAGKLFLLGRNPQGQLSVFERTFNRCMGLWGNGQTLWMSSLYQLWRFENVLRPGESHQGYDRLFIPRAGFTTGDLDVHDVACDVDRRPIFVNTRFSCLSTLSDRHGFKPLWKPPFVNKLAPEDRCHLNGLAMEAGQPRFVTTISRSDVTDGWRDHRRDGGTILDVPSGRIVVTGLSMPHSPRVHRNKLWVLNSGTGYFGHVDLDEGIFRPLTFCAGYMRGLAFSGNHAIVGLSRPRHDRTFSGLALDENLAAKEAEPRCGLVIVDLQSGDIVEWLWIAGMVSELYDVVVLPGVVRPMAFGFKTDDIQRTITFDEQSDV